MNDIGRSKADRRHVLCPHCDVRISISKRLFREDLQCSRCQTPLYVSVNYSRTLVLLSALISFVLLWCARVRFFWLLVLLLPLIALVLSVLVRIAPFVVRPRLYVGEPPSVFTKLNLTR